MPNNEEDTLVTPNDEVAPAEDTQSDAQVTNQPDETNTPSQTVEEMYLGKPKSHWEKMEIENARLKSGQSTLQRKLNRFERQLQDSQSVSGMNEYTQDGDQWVNDLLIKQAEYEMKDGLSEIFDEYPQLPEPIKNAIKRNPRGYVQPGTVYVTDALDDIRDYLDEISQGFGEASVTAPTANKPKQFSVAPTNASKESSNSSKSGKLVEILKSKGGMNELYRRYTEKEITREQLDSALEEAEALGLNVG